jgi:alpha-L-arabinofuranosidase
LGTLERSARVTELTSGNLSDNNTMEEPEKIVPRTRRISLPGPCFEHVFPARSLTVMRVRARR